MLARPRKRKRACMEGRLAGDGTKVVVTRVRGNYMATMGHAEAGTIVLHVEEALFLAESGAMVVSGCGDGGELDPAVLYPLLPRGGSTLEAFLSYKALRGYGFVVRRSGSRVPVRALAAFDVWRPGAKGIKRGDNPPDYVAAVVR